LFGLLLEQKKLNVNNYLQNVEKKYFHLLSVLIFVVSLRRLLMLKNGAKEIRWH